MRKEVQTIPVLKQLITEYASSIGIDLIGFTHGQPFSELKELLTTRAEKGLQSPFEEKDIAMRTNPRIIFPSTRSIISVAVSYNTETEKNYDFNGRGIISRHAWGQDYHQVLLSQMQQLVDFIVRESGRQVEYKMLVDTGPLVDRAVAFRAGIGWYGKNTTLIGGDLGSWIFLGEIMLDLELEPDNPAPQECGPCRRCIEACPTGALTAPYTVNPFRCLSYLTQKKGLIPLPFRRPLGARVYGCDTCQEVCPHNQKARAVNKIIFVPKSPLYYPRLVDLLKMTNAQFRQWFGQSSSGWRGRKVIQRNALVALGNSGDRGMVPLVEDILTSDLRWELRAHAAWALGNLGGLAARRLLEKAKLHETHPIVKQEITQAMERL